MQTLPADVPLAETDSDLVARIAAGERAAVPTLIRRHNQTLYRTARSILKDDADAEDAVQEAWLQALRGIAEFRGESRLSTWLVRIVANEALGRLRSRRRRADVIRLSDDAGFDIDGIDAAETDPMSEHRSTQPERAALDSDLRRLLERRIDDLPDAFRAVFVLRAIEELSVDETAECLGLPAATVRTRYFRARAQLRGALSRDLDLGIGDAFSFAGERCDRIVAGVLARLHAGNPAPPGS